MAPAQVRKAIFDAVHNAKKIDERDVVKGGSEDEEPGVYYTVNYSGLLRESPEGVWFGGFRRLCSGW